MSPVRIGLAPIILATAAITVYSILLPASQNNTHIVTPHTVPPVISVPKPTITVRRGPSATRHRIQATPSPRPAQNSSPGAQPGSGGGNPPLSANQSRQGGNQSVQGSVALLGAPGWNGYCEATGHGPVKLTSSDAYGWHCNDGSGIDDASACAWTYGYSLSQIIGRIQNFYDPNSWQCWRVSRELGAPNFNGYCAATGQGAVQLISTNAYGWHCSGDNGTGDNANAVCAWTYGYGFSQVTNRFANFNDPYSWQCWA